AGRDRRPPRARLADVARGRPGLPDRTLAGLWLDLLLGRVVRAVRPRTRASCGARRQPSRAGRGAARRDGVVALENAAGARAETACHRRGVSGRARRLRAREHRERLLARADRQAPRPALAFSAAGGARAVAE